MANKSLNKTRPFNIQELEDKAEIYERWARTDKSPAWKAIHATKARRIRSLLHHLERIGWTKRSTKTNAAADEELVETR